MKVTGERIRLRRQVLRMSQEELAGAVDSSQRQVSKYERGVNMPSGEALMRLAVVLETTADYLLGLTDAVERPDGHVDNLDGLEREVIRLLRGKRQDERLKAVEVLKVL